MSGIELQQGTEVVCIVDQYGKIIAASEIKDKSLSSMFCYNIKGWQGPCPDCPVNIEAKKFLKDVGTLTAETLLDINLNKSGYFIKITRDNKEFISPIAINIGNATAIACLTKQIQNTFITNQELEKDLELGGQIQSSMMTEGWANPIVLLDLFFKPFQRVSGDIFDIQEDSTRGIFFMIGDVTGHGVGPALIGTYIKSFVYQHLSRAEKMEIASFATYMNHELSRLIRSGDFITMFMGYLHLPDLRLEYICMGHPQPFLIRDGDLFEIVENIRHVPLLMVDNVKYDSSSMQLKKNDIILLYTDGVIDIENEKKEKLGIAGLRDLFINVAKRGSDKEKFLLSTEMHSELCQFAGGCNYLDDITLASIKIIDNTIQKKTLSPDEKEDINVTELEDVFRRN